MYMNHLAHSHWLVSQFCLSKDVGQWGLVDDDSDSVFYIFWPPWARPNPTASQKCAATTVLPSHAHSTS